MNRGIQDILQAHIAQDDTIIIGVSGGPDSVYLLLQALQYTKKIIIAHLDHQTRGKESKKDAEFTHSLAKKNNLPFEIKKIPKKTKGNTEEYFRNQRYAFFEAVRKKYKAKWILTAHHLNDNIETVLFNLAKGSSIDGLSGMEMVDPDRKLLRPLLFTPKETILKYLEETKTPYKEDQTNKDTAYARNRVRHNVIPELKTINSSLEQTLAQNIANLQELKAYLREMSASWIEQHSQERTISLKAFQKLHPAMQKNVLFRLYENYHGQGKRLNQSHLNQILKIVHQSRTNRKKEFGKGCTLLITKENGERVIQITKEK